MLHHIVWPWGLMEDKMAQQRSEAPYIWATLLSRLMSGAKSCKWSAWFRAHHEGWSWEKLPSSFDSRNWAIAHTDGINACGEEWEAFGNIVRVEGQNQFRLCGWTAAISGKPDLVALRGQHGTVIDVKTGQPRE